MKIILYCLLLFLNIEIFAQINQTITGASPGRIDTVSVERAQKVSDENKGIVDKPVNPKLYEVGPGDEFKIIINQYKPLELEAKVTPESKIYIPKIGIIEADELLLEDVYILIKKEIKKVYNTDDIFIVLNKVRQFKVRLSGNVPKSMTIPAFATDRVSEVIDKAGALKENSSIRNIKLIRGDDKELIRVDLAKFFATSEDRLNPYVKGGDHIIVPGQSEDIEIKIHGEVPVEDATYEFIDGDSLSTLVRLAQGFLKTAFLDSVEFVRYNHQTKDFEIKILNLNSWRNLIYNFNEKLEGDFPLIAGDRLYIRKDPYWVKNKYIKVDGEVKFPGKYAIKNNDTRISDIIKLAGGLTNDASPELSEYIRQEEADLPDFELERLRKIPPTDMSESERRYFQSRVNEKKGLMSVNLIEALSDPNSIDNIIVENRDSLFIPKKKNYIIVQGRVNSPGAIIFNKGFTYLQYIELAGGYGFRADDDETFITKPGGQQYLASEMNYTLEPGDVILVPPQRERDYWETFLETFTLVTQILTVASVVITLSRTN